MYSRQRAADAAKSLLHNASQRLLTYDPTEVPEVSGALDQSLDWSMDPHPPGYQRHFEPNFSETSANTLAFLVNPGDYRASPQDRRELSTRAMREIVGRQLGSQALHWLDSRLEPYNGRYGSPRISHRGLGAMYTAGLDRGGVSEAAVSYEWGPDTGNTLPTPVYEFTRKALETLPGLVPFYTTIRCGRQSGGQQVTFEIDRPLPLAELKPLMDAFGMGHRHGGLLSLTGFMLGARFTLPPRTATLTLMRTQGQVEMRLDINLDALPDTPEQLLPLLRLPMTERPRSLAAMDRWVTALTPEGYHGPGNVSVLSVRVRADLPARVALFLRPIAFQPESPDSSGANGNRNGSDSAMPANDGLAHNAQPSP